jgi:hypothetical protein
MTTAGYYDMFCEASSDKKITLTAMEGNCIIIIGVIFSTRYIGLTFVKWIAGSKTPCQSRHNYPVPALKRKSNALSIYRVTVHLIKPLGSD